MPIASRKKILIVGAGIAGLAACKELMAAGDFDVTILEARNRCGGRIWIDDSLGYPLDLGASWMHGTEGNPLMPVANKTHTPMAQLDPNKSYLYDSHSKLISIPERNLFDDKFAKILEQAHHYARTLARDMPLALALAHFIEKETLTSVESDLLEAQFRFIEGYIGANSAALSAQHWDDEEVIPGGNHYLTHSYQAILSEIQSGCAVQLETIVQAIHVKADGVEVFTNKNTLQADAVIITVPLGVLKKNQIEFSPPLPYEKQQAIDNLGMGIFNLTVMQFPHAFWPDDAHIIRFSKLPDPAIHAFFNLGHFIHQPVLIGLSGGSSAQALEQLSDDEVASITVENFKSVYGDNVPVPEKICNTRWSQDPFSHGSYSYIPPGASSKDHDTISASIADRLYFAGEATSARYPATTHGAYLSGIREAEKIKNHFKN